MRYYKKITGSETFVLSVDANNNYAIASNLDPEPDTGIGLVWGDKPGQKNPAEWQECSREEAAEILGYDPEEGKNKKRLEWSHSTCEHPGKGYELEGKTLEEAIELAKELNRECAYSAGGFNDEWAWDLAEIREDGEKVTIWFAADNMPDFLPEEGRDE